jgi:ketosteroid isomerase-like protein
VSEMLRVIQRGYELLWREGRIEESVGTLPPDFEWVVPGMPEGDVRRGPEGVTEFVREWIEPFEDLQVEWEIEEVSPGRALAVIDMCGRGRESGAPVEMRFAQLWTFSKRRLERMVMYQDIDEARRDAGL